MVVPQAEASPSDAPGPPRERLAVETEVGHGPIQVFPGQGLAYELTVIHCPSVPVIISLGPHNDCHVGQELRGLVWKSGRHDGKLLDPDQDVGDPGRVGRWPAIGCS